MKKSNGVYASNPCVILGIDPGKEWGAAILRPAEKLSFYLESSVGDAKGYIVTVAANIAAAEKVRLVIVAEKWVPFGFRMTAAAFMGLSAEWGKWLAEIERLPARKPATKIVRVYPQTWRAAVLGGSASSQWKARAQAYVRARYGVNVDDNAAEAICIALWGTHAAEVRGVLGKREVGATA